MTTIEGEKLNEAPGEVGAGLLQLSVQQAIAALTLAAPPQSLTFFLQHSIADIPFSAPPEKTGVPASTLKASAESRKADVSHFFIFRFSVFGKLNAVKNQIRQRFPPDQTRFPKRSFTAAKIRR